MTKSRRVLLIAALVIAAVLACVALAAVFLLDGDRYRERLETEVSQALNLDVRFQGPIGIRFTPALRIRFSDVQVSRHGERIASLGGALFGVELMPLLSREIRVRSVMLDEPVLAVARDRAGGFNFGIPEALGARLRALGLTEVSVTNGTLRFDDEKSGEKIEARNCDVDLRNLRVPENPGEDALRTISFDARFDCEAVQSGKLLASALSGDAQATRGVITIDPLAATIFGAQGEGSAQVDFTAEQPAMQVVFALPQFPMQAFFEQMGTEAKAEGRLDFTASLSMRGASAAAMKRSLAGNFSLRGKDLVLTGIDLDESLSRFEASQSFTLVDVGAVFLAGPFGLVATQGYRFGSLAMTPGGRSDIRTLVSDWRIEKGVARATDVALATGENRVAARGALDFVNQRFQGLTVALLDARGCARVEQELSGSFEQAQANRPNILELISGPARSLIQRGVDLFSGDECDVFYAGSVKAPG